jgi:hypothetical protein
MYDDDIIPFWDEDEMDYRQEILGENVEPIDFGDSDFDIDPDMGDH